MRLLPRFSLISLCLAVALGLVAPKTADAAVPTVVASVPPIHSLVAGVMEGIGTPYLLVSGGASPHTYALKPSDARHLVEADLVFWVGPDLESFLVKALDMVRPVAGIVELAEAPGVTLLPTRLGGVWPAHQDEEHGHEGEADHDGHHHGPLDMHIWLDPANATAVVADAAEALSRRDPEHAAAYAANAARVAARLGALEAELQHRLDPIADRPFIVFHDAYQYFERAFGLSVAGAATVGPDRLPGARRLAKLRARITGAGVSCIFSEPQFTPKLAEALIAGTPVRLGVLDPLGAGLEPGPNLYFDLMRKDADALVDCLGR